MASGNETRTIYLDGYDITKWVIKLPKTPQLKPDWGEIPSLKQLEIQVRSDDFAFHPYHQVSFLYGRRYDEMELRVEQYGQVQWKGDLLDARHDGQRKQTTLVGESVLQRQLNTSGRLDSNLLTPSEAAQNILILHNVSTHAASFAAATNLLNDTPCRVSVNPDVLEWQGTLGDILKLLMSAGIGRLYLTPSGTIGMDSYALDSSPTIALTLSDDDIRQWPKTNDQNMEPLAGYRIKYEYDEEVSTDVTEDILSLDFGPTAPVTMATQNSAIYCGDTWQALSQRDYTDFVLPLAKSFALVLELGSFVTLTSTKLGIDRTLEVIGTDNSDPRWFAITARLDKGVS
jgi:hypothetical protein